MSMIERVQREAEARIRKSAEERERARQLVEDGDALGAEPDHQRLVARLMNAVDVNSGVAEKLAENIDPLRLGLKGDRLMAAERIQGKTADFLGVAFLELGWSASQTVARIASRNRQPIGSGFLISDRLLITNNHVFDTKESARAALVQFRYEMDGSNKPREVVEFELAPDELFITRAETDLDFTIVAVGKPLGGRGNLVDFGFSPLSGASDKHKIGEFVSIVQHPEGDYKQVVVRENMITYRGSKVLHYEADTNPGSSGSPVFNDQWQVVALHHTGAPALEVRDSDGRQLPKAVNEGVRISAIIEVLEKELAELTGEAKNLLQAALQTSQPAPRAPVPNGRAEAHRDSTPADPAPIEVVVRIHGRELTTKVDGRAFASFSDGAGERVQIDGDYENRGGYDSNFLDVEVPLPKLDRSHTAARVRGAGRSNPFELKYEHFSIVMNRRRRMAYFTAVNIEGKAWRVVNRDTGEPEASETWFIDDRIDADAQLNQQHFSQQHPTRLFDRGHLVRRQDPTWGTRAAAKRANADTFHFTNCSTQASMFNQSAKLWGGLEAYVLDNAREEDVRLCLFNGPVFEDDDPPFRDILVPKRFWKVLARMENGTLLATALIADQSDLIDNIPERMTRRERFSDIDKVAHFQVAIGELEHLTGLDLGPLREADTFRAGRGERASTGMRRLGSLEDIDLGAAARRRGTSRPHGSRDAPSN